jgi:hypothetical protein
MQHAETAGDAKEQCWIGIDRLLSALLSYAPPDEQQCGETQSALQEICATIHKSKWVELEPLWQCAWTASACSTPRAQEERGKLEQLAEELERKLQPLEALSCWRVLERLAVRSGSAEDEAAAYRLRAARIRRDLGLGDEPY